MFSLVASPSCRRPDCPINLASGVGDKKMVSEEFVKDYIDKAKAELKASLSSDKEALKKDLVDELGELITGKHLELEEKIKKVSEKVEDVFW